MKKIKFKYIIVYFWSGTLVAQAELFLEREAKVEENNTRKYKVLALDLDGTLMTNDKKISPAVKEAIYEMREKGFHVVLASGRPTPGMYYVADELEMKKYGGFILSFNGGCITDYKTNKIVYSQTIPENFINDIKEYVKETQCEVATYRGNDIITTNDKDEYIKKEAFITRMNVCKTDYFWDNITFPVNKFLLTAKPEYAREIAYDMSEEFYGRLNVFRSEPFFVEVCPLGIDKGRSLSKLLEILGCSREELVACGDGYNDLTMIEYAGLGVSMENGCRELKEKADYICPSNENDGIAHVISRFFLNQTD